MPWLTSETEAIELSDGHIRFRRSTFDRCGSYKCLGTSPKKKPHVIRASVDSERSSREELVNSINSFLLVSGLCIIEPMPDEINGVPAATLSNDTQSIGKGLGARIETCEHADS